MIYLRGTRSLETRSGYLTGRARATLHLGSSRGYRLVYRSSLGGAVIHIVGSYEAKTRLPELLRAVELGETVTITRRGVPIARLVSVGCDVPEEPAAVIARMKSARARRPPVSVDEILAARDEGRRG